VTARIEPLLVADAVSVGWLLASSYGEDPACRSIWPDSRVRARALRALFTACARDAAHLGGAVVAKDAAGAVGVALWLPPGRFPASPARRARAVPAALRAVIAAPAAFPRYATVTGRLSRSDRRVGQPHWYLRAMGVHPRARRRGVGALLLAPVLARADEEGNGCRLHLSDRATVAYYERFGFRVRPPEVRVRPGGPSYLGMDRPPQLV
jgi:GNAT superfamily N-acetyltransferase